jgi:hypothetical protein
MTLNHSELTRKTKALIITIFITALLGTLVWLSDSFWPAIFLIVIAFLFYSLRFRKYKLLIFSSIIFIALHLIIAPFVYVIALKLNPDSFSVDKQILINEQSGALKDATLNHFSNRANLSSIEQVLINNNVALNAKLAYLNQGNLLKVDTFNIIREETHSTGPVTEGMPYSSLIIFNNHGLKICDVEIGVLETDSQSIKSFLYKQRLTLLASENEFRVLKSKIAKRDIWNYERVLPYVLDVYDTSNFKPISPAAQVIHSIHVVVVFILLLGFFPTAFYELLKGFTA